MHWYNHVLLQSLDKSLVYQAWHKCFQYDFEEHLVSCHILFLLCLKFACNSAVFLSF